MNIRYYTFWSINAALDRKRLGNDLRAFKEFGLDGVVFHPRFYPDTPPYLSDDYLEIVSDTILDAKKLGLAFWIYDENGWPSGTVSGQMLEKYPRQAQQWAGLVDKCPDECLAEFSWNGKAWYLSHRLGRGVNYLDPETARAFIELTHERYRKGLSPEAFEYVETIFCDEPECGLGHAYDMLLPDGAIPWTTKLPELFELRYGKKLLPQISQLFFPEEGYQETRIQFWELIADLFRDSFVKPIDQWCKKYGKRFTGHVKGEEHPYFQVPIIGSNHRALSGMSLPGIDALERYPLNDFFPRQAASVSAQFSDGRVMVEALGGSGWGLRPEDMERYLLWLGRNGLTDFVFHLSQHRLDSNAIHDWPPSQPLHLNWKEAYPEVLKRVRSRVESLPAAPVDTLVIAPYRGVMAEYETKELLQMNVHNGAATMDTPALRLNRKFMQLVEKLNAMGIPHHYIDEATFEEGNVKDGFLRVGNCAYKKVIVSEGAILQNTGRTLLHQIGGATESIAVNIAIPFNREQKERRSIQVTWSNLEVQPNHFVLDGRRANDGLWNASFETLGKLANVTLFFADEVHDVQVNGKCVVVQTFDNGMFLGLEEYLVGGMNEVKFQTNAHDPFVWMEGNFLVKSKSQFFSADNSTLKTKGGWQLQSQDKREIPGEFVSAGYPFNRLPLMLSGKFEYSGGNLQTLEMVGCSADAVRVFLDGKNLGFTYGPDWQIPLGGGLKSGSHDIRLEMIPSTYNFYGPHHYCHGDAPVISPDQYAGKKNFLEGAGDPECTKVEDWHFCPLRVPSFFMV